MKTIKLTSTFYVCLGIFMICFLSGVAQNGTLQYPTSETDLTTAMATVDAYENEEWENLRLYLAPDAKVYGLGSFDSLSVDETIAYWTQGSETASPSLDNKTWLAISVADGPRKGNWIYHWGDNTLNYPNGEHISFPYHLALKLEGTKVKEAHFYYDNMKIIRHLGYAISPPLEEENNDNSLDVKEITFDGPTKKK